MENLKLCDSDYRFMLVVGSGTSKLRRTGAAVPRAAWMEKVNNIHTDQENVRKKGISRIYTGDREGINPKERVQADESDYFVERTFDGPLPAFLTAFLGGKTITEKEADKIKRMIDEHVQNNLSVKEMLCAGER